MTVYIGLPSGESVCADFLDANGFTKQANQVRGVEPVLHLWLLTQTENTGYDTYDSMVVAAYDETTAKRMHPQQQPKHRLWDDGVWRRDEDVSDDELEDDGTPYFPGKDMWATHPDRVTAVCVGVAIGREPGEFVCASFNAG